MQPRTAILAVLSLAIIPGLASSVKIRAMATPAGHSSLSSTTVTHGLRIVLQVSRDRYPLNSLIDTNIRVQNVTVKAIKVVSSPCTGQYTHTEALDTHGVPIPWPLPIERLPCPLPFPQKLQPGKTITTTSIAYLQSGVLRADVTIDEPNAGFIEVPGNPLTIATYAAAPEHATFASTPGSPGGYPASIWPVPKNPGKLFVVSVQICDQFNGEVEQVGGLPGDWNATTGSVVSTSILGPGCVKEKWDLIAGWIGYPVASLRMPFDQLTSERIRQPPSYR